MQGKNQVYKIIIFVFLVLVIIEGLLLIHLLKKRRKETAPAAKFMKGRIAIVLDDWGYNLNNVALLGQIKAPLTLSVLPHLPYSKRIADEAHAAGFKVILHLPLEPHEKMRLEQDTITTVMDGQTIRRILVQDIDSLSHVEGVSNHMGSKATNDYKIMGVILSEIKKRHMYFLDSLVSGGSVCSLLAQKLKLRFIKRDFFLDHKEDASFIRGQIAKLKSKAGHYGYAVGIGHDRKVTIEVLKEAIPELEREGYEFVFVSDLVQ